MNRFPLRPGMDVYSAYQDEYIGSVVRLLLGSAGSGRGTQEGERNPTRSPDPSAAGGAAPSNIGLVHEEGAVVGHTENKGSRMLGEEMGPVPTAAGGNSGPLRQSAAHAYATTGEPPLPDVRWLVVRPGRLNLGILTSPLYVPGSAIRSISMERIVLDVQRDSMPPAWRRRPTP